MGLAVPKVDRIQVNVALLTLPPVYALSCEDYTSGFCLVCWRFCRFSVTGFEQWRTGNVHHWWAEAPVLHCWPGPHFDGSLYAGLQDVAEFASNGAGQRRPEEG